MKNQSNENGEKDRHTHRQATGREKVGEGAIGKRLLPNQK